MKVSASVAHRLPPHSKNESARLWRLLGGPVCALLPNGLELTPAQCSESAALSSTARSASFSEAGRLRRGWRSPSSESLEHRQGQNASQVNPDSLPFASLNYWPVPPSSTCSLASANPSPCGTACQATGHAVITGEHRRTYRVAGKPAVLTIVVPLPLRKGMMTEKPRDLSTPEDSDGPLRSFEELGAALGLDRANVTLLEENPALDTEAATRAKVEKAPYSVQKVGREALKLWIEPLADCLAKRTPPRGLEQVLRGLDHQQLALIALRSALDQMHFGWDKRKDRKDGKRTVKNPDMLFRLELGRAVRDELEFAGLLAAKKYVKAARNKHAALGRLKFRRVDWTNAECAQVGDWLWDALSEMSCFNTDARGFPCFHADHKAALDKLAEEVLFDHPLYKPRLAEPSPWTAWRVECPGDIAATFVKANDPETIGEIKAAFEEAAQVRLIPRERTGANNFWTEAEAFETAGPSDAEDTEDISIELHARAVSAIH